MHAPKLETPRRTGVPRAPRLFVHGEKCSKIELKESIFRSGARSEVPGHEVANGPSVLRERLEPPHVRTRGADGAVLEEHAQDGHHRQATVRELRVQLPLPEVLLRLDGVEGADEAEAVVARLA